VIEHVDSKIQDDESSSSSESEDQGNY
jgi:hypothetical protein